ncbi:MAG: ferrous iron transport protein B [Deltaproteobacteria bacterium RBG_13_52_11]|nr:MAG: ferrous iron transport protein B [Deltaproteobacteria bacterium RBG_13_52_11]
MEKEITIALAGNPNSGKTTIFNNLTGARQKVGNWPGVTVEKKEGTTAYNGYTIRVVDLPGTYSLTAYSQEEIIARNYIIEEKPDLVVDVIDAANLERNLYLATQLIDLGVKLVFALNMVDMAQSRGQLIDHEQLSLLMGVPFVPTVGTKGQGTGELLQAIVRVAEDRESVFRHIHINYGKELEEEITTLQGLIRSAESSVDEHHARWIGIKLLENDEEVIKEIEKGPRKRAILDQLEQSKAHLQKILGDDPETLIADRRYGFIHGALKETLRHTRKNRRYRSDQVDMVLTNRLLGFPIFIFFIWAMFQLTFNVGRYPVTWIDAGVGLLAQSVGGLMGESLLRGLVVDGIISGVGGVAVFLPNIFILFFCIALFEDTGYMARAAFIMDKVMHTLGLHGKSFIPMIMGFGCNVPAIMATRVLESRRDRILTILINPLISCSGRLPIYVLIAGAVFGARAGNVIFSIYIIGIVMAILMGQIFKRTLFRGEIAPFVLELPPYRMPTLKGTLIHMWERGSMFIKKMGGIILIGSIVVWALSSFPQNVDYSRDYEGQRRRIQAEYAAEIQRGDKEQAAVLTEEMERKIAAVEILRKREFQEKSLLGRLGKVIAPALRPLGFDWKADVALLTGFVAKEIVVSTFGVLYQANEEGDESDTLRVAIQKAMTPLVGYAFMIFVLVYTPCLATVAAIRRETGTWGWAAFSVVYSLALAWILAFLIYQGGMLLGLG